MAIISFGWREERISSFLLLFMTVTYFLDVIFSIIGIGHRYAVAQHVEALLL